MDGSELPAKKVRGDWRATAIWVLTWEINKGGGVRWRGNEAKKKLAGRKQLEPAFPHFSGANAHLGSLYFWRQHQTLSLLVCFLIVDKNFNSKIYSSSIN
jgi:hypothetical protein